MPSSRPQRAILAWISTLFVGGAFLFADTLRRIQGRQVPWLRHVPCSVALSLAVAAWAFVFVFLASEIWVAVGRRFHAQPWRRRLVRTVLSFGVCAAAVAPTAWWMFQGTQAQRFLPWGPYLVMLAVGLGGSLYAGVLSWLMSGLRRGRRRRALCFALLALALGAVLVRLDLTLFVALYARLHTVLEVVAALLWLGAAALLLAPLSARLRPRLVLGLFATSFLWSVTVGASTRVRDGVEHALRHVWLEPAYLGRSMSRLQTGLDLLTHPEDAGSPLARMDSMKRRYDLATTSQSALWDQPVSEPPELAKQLAALRLDASGKRRDLNIAVFYVDTLRSDAATDPEVMPNVARFLNGQSLSFSHAYATGSDTMRSLPGLTTGRMELKPQHSGDLLRVAERSGRRTANFLAKSSYRFLQKERPTFRFEDSVAIPDYAADKQVWGYGADESTSERVVDSALSWLDDHQQDPFLIWLFHFDQHNWRELKKDWVQAQAERLGVPEEAALNWRYRVVARAVDEQFGRFMAELKRRKLLETTAVLFVSDHGEALGRDGFWVHSIFLWECLIRVPLGLYLPGVPPRVVDAPVSLADVTPTLVRYLEDKPDMRGYHGVDLLTTVVPNAPPRPRPILFAGASHEKLLRIGLLDPTGQWKLVLPIESGVPELYDTREADPDWKSRSDASPTMVLQGLSTMVRSPLFPRSEQDLDVKARAEQVKTAEAPVR